MNLKKRVSRAKLKGIVEGHSYILDQANRANVMAVLAKYLRGRR